LLPGSETLLFVPTTLDVFLSSTVHHDASRPFDTQRRYDTHVISAPHIITLNKFGSEIEIMNKLATTVAALGLAAVSASASAWGPWNNGGNNGWGNNGFGDGMGDMLGDGDFGMNFSGRGNGYGRGYGSGRDTYYGGYNGYNGYPGYGAPYGGPYGGGPYGAPYSGAPYGGGPYGGAPYGGAPYGAQGPQGPYGVPQQAPVAR
jgi:Sulphur globule protein